MALRLTMGQAVLRIDETWRVLRGMRGAENLGGMSMWETRHYIHDTYIRGGALQMKET